MVYFVAQIRLWKLFWQRSRPRPQPRLAPPESGFSCAVRRRGDGGLDSEVGSKRGNDIYFMGIIDILQASPLAKAYFRHQPENNLTGRSISYSHLGTAGPFR